MPEIHSLKGLKHSQHQELIKYFTASSQYKLFHLRINQELKLLISICRTVPGGIRRNNRRVDDLVSPHSPPYMMTMHTNYSQTVDKTNIYSYRPSFNIYFIVLYSKPAGSPWTALSLTRYGWGNRLSLTYLNILESLLVSLVFVDVFGCSFAEQY